VVRYQLVVTNSGDRTATGVSVTDLLPTNLLYVSGSIAPSTIGNGQITRNIGTLNVGTSVILQITTALTGSWVPGTTVLLNTGTVQFSGNELTTGNNTSMVTQTIGGNVGITATKSATPTQLISGDTVTFTLGYANNGTVPVTNVRFVDLLPAQLALTNGSLS
jgi:uncharacterized repeat protein (TIGR01451 family)